MSLFTTPKVVLRRQSVLCPAARRALARAGVLIAPLAIGMSDRRLEP